METRALKKYGQNFLINDEISKKIASFLPYSEYSSFLEIGPGRGALTSLVYERIKSLETVEIDENLVNYLKEKMPELTVYNKNFKKLEISKYDVIFGNVPYNITSEILVKCMKEATNCKYLLFMIQKEAYERIVVAEKQEEKTPLSVMISIFYEYELKMNVNRLQFDPQPNVDSVVFALKRRNDEIEINRKQFYNYLLVLFSSRRKNIVNNLIKKYNKEKVLATISSLSIDSNLRSEKLTNEQFIALYLELIK